MLSVLLGVVAGVGAYAFRLLIGLFHNLLLLGRASFDYDANVHTVAGVWGPLVVLAPVVAALVVVYMVEHFAPEARGHGVPEVMDAIYYKKGVIRPVVAVVKSLASALSIGSGGSVGREGPIIQIGSAVGSWAGRVAGVSRWQLITLVAAGGGAGIAATFNTPIGGVLFAVEVLLHEVSVRTLVPVALATATATFVGQFLFGNHPAFAIPLVEMTSTTHALLLPAYVALGALMAVIGVAFIKSLYGTEDRLERWFHNPYLRHALGMFGVGVTMVGLMETTGHYYVEGVGYATILDVVHGTLTGVGFLFVLFVLKLWVTSLTLGSGASGGIFSPALVMGATLGGGCGIVVASLLPQLHIDPVAFALAGMAGLVASVTGAALTAIVMLFEMTLDYSLVLPMTVTVSVAYGLRRLLMTDSIYTMKLTRRGHVMPQALQANAHLVHHVGELVMANVEVLQASDPPERLAIFERMDSPCHAVIVDGDEVVGAVSREWAVSHAEQVRAAGTLAELASPELVVASSDTTLFDLLARMQRAHVQVAVVRVVAPEEPQCKGGCGVRGVVTLAHIAEAIAEGMEMFAD